ncbi:serine/threonine-protein kinase [Colletotrichum nymphaeae SA-01]|uniref:Serine/threonine-protein kinase n=1 Tax=Colletotrichum nymphaeae SA-01 TaxID=1460502 RepID=A0A135RYN3_9PEZI|nr:serine/threonine-protein kinase [Colletotrichum nymphaeae SA-01]
MNVSFWYSIAIIAAIMALLLRQSLWSTRLRFSIYNKHYHPSRVRPILLQALVPRRYLGSLSFLHILLIIVFIAGNGLATGLTLEGPENLRQRAATLGSINLAPVFIGRRVYANRIFGASKQTYHLTHSCLGLVGLIQVTLHVGIAIRTHTLSIVQDCYLFYTGLIILYHWETADLTVANRKDQAPSTDRASSLFFLVQDNSSRVKNDTEILLDGPYGCNKHPEKFETVVLVAQGRGIAGVLPVALSIALIGRHDRITRRIDLQWKLDLNDQEEWAEERLQGLINLDPHRSLFAAHLYYPRLRARSLKKLAIPEKHSKQWNTFRSSHNESMNRIRRNIVAKSRYAGHMIVLACGDKDFTQQIQSFVFRLPTLAEFSHIEMPSSSHTAEPQGLRIDILDKREAFEEVEGVFKFTKTVIIFKSGEEIYHAAVPSSEPVSSELSETQLINKLLVPTAAYKPPFSCTFTRAPDPLPTDTYIKTPSLLSYDQIHNGPQPNQIADDVLNEVRICELLRESPHPNLAKYIGCQVSDGNISGICFVRYGKTLMEAVNPRGLMKRKFSTTHRDLGDFGRGLQGIQAGIAHLHSLGIVHNDINPSNIMIDGDEWVIIDFGSCRKLEESLVGVGRTYEWYDEAIQHSCPENDLNALLEIHTWLRGAPADAFQFTE